MRALLLAALFLMPAAPTYAHADLTGTDPANSQTLETAPEQITLTFNEDVTLLESTELRSETTVDYDAEVNAGVVTLTPERPLDAGTWTLAWRVVSSDGHPVGGTLRFVVGEPTTTNAGEAGAAIDEPDPVLLDRSLEALTWIALAAGAGMLLVGKRRNGATAAAAGVVLALLRTVDAVERYGSDISSIGEARSAIVTATAALGMVALARRPVLAAHGGLLLFAIGATQSGHHARLDNPLFSLLHAGHVYLGLLWAAGLVAILADPEHAARTSRTITKAVCALIPVGALYAAGMLVADYGTWEKTLTVKITLVTVALMLGAISHLALKRTGTGDVRKRTLLEIFVLLAVAATTASLTTSTPGKFAIAATETVGSGSIDIAEEPAAGTAESSAELLFEDGTSLPLHTIWSPDTGQLTVHVTTDGTVEQAEYLVADENGETAANGTFTAGQVLSTTIELPGGGTWLLRLTTTSGFATTVGETTLELP